jgi:hypothetical protein
MAHTYSIDEDLNLLVVKFRGTIPYSEEAEAVLTILEDPRIKPDVRILVDRTESSFGSATETVTGHIERVGSKLSSLGKPRVAVVVSSDLAFGMLRMFGSMAEGQLNHEFGVFRTLPEGCDWLQIELDQISWPD